MQTSVMVEIQDAQSRDPVKATATISPKSDEDADGISSEDVGNMNNHDMGRREHLDPICLTFDGSEGSNMSM